MSKNINNFLSFNPISGFTGTVDEYNTIMESEIIETKKKLVALKNEPKKSFEEEKKEIEKKFKKNQNFYEAYDPAKFETKLRIDLLFYEHLFEKLPEINDVEDVIIDYYKTVKDIYEAVNMLPENHKMLNTSVLVESQSDQQKRFSKILSEHINNNYYTLTPDKRKEKFLEESKEYSANLVNRGLDVEKSIGIGIKSCLMESLIRNIALPKNIQKRVTFLCEDEDYGKVFDQDNLKTLWEDFSKKSKNIASIIAFGV